MNFRYAITRRNYTKVCFIGDGWKTNCISNTLPFNKFITRSILSDHCMTNMINTEDYNINAYDEDFNLIEVIPMSKFVEDNYEFIKTSYMNKCESAFKKLINK